MKIDELESLSAEFLATFLAENGDAALKLGADTVKGFWAEQMYRRIGIPALSANPSPAELAKHAEVINRRSVVIALIAQAELKYRDDADELRAKAIAQVGQFVGSVGFALLKGLL